LNRVFLLLGLAANFINVLIVEPLWSALDHNVAITLITSLLLTSAALTVTGVRKRGQINADTAGIIVIGNSPAWIFGALGLVGAFADYQDNLSKCQLYSVGINNAVYNCNQVPYAIFLIGLFVAILVVAIFSTAASLLTLRRLSLKE